MKLFFFSFTFLALGALNVVLAFEASPLNLLNLDNPEIHKREDGTMCFATIPEVLQCQDLCKALYSYYANYYSEYCHMFEVFKTLSAACASCGKLYPGTGAESLSKSATNLIKGCGDVPEILPCSEGQVPATLPGELPELADTESCEIATTISDCVSACFYSAYKLNHETCDVFITSSKTDANSAFCSLASCISCSKSYTFMTYPMTNDFGQLFPCLKSSAEESSFVAPAQTSDAMEPVDCIESIPSQDDCESLCDSLYSAFSNYYSDRCTLSKTYERLTALCKTCGQAYPNTEAFTSSDNTLYLIRKCDAIPTIPVCSANEQPIEPSETFPVLSGTDACKVVGTISDCVNACFNVGSILENGSCETFLNSAKDKSTTPYCSLSTCLTCTNQFSFMVNPVEFDIAESLACLKNMDQESSTAELSSTEPSVAESSFTQSSAALPSETSLSPQEEECFKNFPTEDECNILCNALYSSYSTYYSERCALFNTYKNLNALCKTCGSAYPDGDAYFWSDVTLSLVQSCGTVPSIPQCANDQEPSPESENLPELTGTDACTVRNYIDDCVTACFKVGDILLSGSCNVFLESGKDNANTPYCSLSTCLTCVKSFPFLVYPFQLDFENTFSCLENIPEESSSIEETSSDVGSSTVPIVELSSSDSWVESASETNTSPKDVECFEVLPNEDDCYTLCNGLYSAYASYYSDRCFISETYKSLTALCGACGKEYPDGDAYFWSDVTLDLIKSCNTVPTISKCSSGQVATAPAAKFPELSDTESCVVRNYVDDCVNACFKVGDILQTGSCDTFLESGKNDPNSPYCSLSTCLTCVKAFPFLVYPVEFDIAESLSCLTQSDKGSSSVDASSTQDISESFSSEYSSTEISSTEYVYTSSSEESSVDSAFKTSSFSTESSMDPISETSTLLEDIECFSNLPSKDQCATLCVDLYYGYVLSSTQTKRCGLFEKFKTLTSLCVTCGSLYPSENAEFWSKSTADSVKNCGSIPSIPICETGQNPIESSFKLPQLTETQACDSGTTIGACVSACFSVGNLLGSGSCNTFLESGKDEASTPYCTLSTCISCAAEFPFFSYPLEYDIAESLSCLSNSVDESSLSEHIEESSSVDLSSSESLYESSSAGVSSDESLNESSSVNESTSESANESSSADESTSESANEPSSINESSSESANESSSADESTSESANEPSSVNESSSESANESSSVNESSSELANESSSADESISEPPYESSSTIESSSQSILKSTSDFEFFSQSNSEYSSDGISSTNLAMESSLSSYTETNFESSFVSSELSLDLHSVTSYFSDHSIESSLVSSLSSNSDVELFSTGESSEESMTDSFTENSSGNSAFESLPIEKSSSLSIEESSSYIQGSSSEITESNLESSLIIISSGESSVESSLVISDFDSTSTYIFESFSSEVSSAEDTAKSSFDVFSSDSRSNTVSEPISKSYSSEAFSAKVSEESSYKAVLSDSVSESASESVSESSLTTSDLDNSVSLEESSSQDLAESSLAESSTNSFVESSTAAIFSSSETASESFESVSISTSESSIENLGTESISYSVSTTLLSESSAQSSYEPSLESSGQHVSEISSIESSLVSSASESEFFSQSTSGFISTESSSSVEILESSSESLIISVLESTSESISETISDFLSITSASSVPTAESTLSIIEQSSLSYTCILPMMEKRDVNLMYCQNACGVLFKGIEDEGSNCNTLQKYQTEYSICHTCKSVYPDNIVFDESFIQLYESCDVDVIEFCPVETPTENISEVSATDSEITMEESLSESVFSLESQEGSKSGPSVSESKSVWTSTSSATHSEQDIVSSEPASSGASESQEESFKSTVTTSTEISTNSQVETSKPATTVTETAECHQCITKAVTTTSFATITRTSGTFIVTVTEPCETTYTVIVSPLPSEGYTTTTLTKISTVTEHPTTITKTCSQCVTTTIISTGATTVTKTFGTSTTVITEPCETEVTAVVSPLTFGGFTTITLTKTHDDFESHDVVSTRYTTYTSFVSGGSIITVTEPCETVTISSHPEHQQQSTVIETSSGYTTYTTVLGSRTVVVTEPCETTVTRVISTNLVSAPESQKHIATTTTFVSSGYKTVTTVSGGEIVTVTEPCETTVTLVVSKPMVISPEVEKPVTSTFVSRGYTTVTTISGKDVITITEPWETTITSVVSLESSPIISSEHTVVPFTTTIISSGFTTITATSGDKVVTITEPCETTVTSVILPKPSSVSKDNEDKKPSNTEAVMVSTFTPISGLVKSSRITSYGTFESTQTAVVINSEPKESGPATLSENREEKLTKTSIAPTTVLESEGKTTASDESIVMSIVTEVCETCIESKKTVYKTIVSQFTTLVESSVVVVVPGVSQATSGSGLEKPSMSRSSEQHSPVQETSGASSGILEQSNGGSVVLKVPGVLSSSVTVLFCVLFCLI